MGYAFVNFITPERAEEARHLLSMSSWTCLRSTRRIKVRTAYTQGLADNLAFCAGRVPGDLDPDRHPLVWRDGQRISFHDAVRLVTPVPSASSSQAYASAAQGAFGQPFHDGAGAARVDDTRFGGFLPPFRGARPAARSPARPHSVPAVGGAAASSWQAQPRPPYDHEVPRLGLADGSRGHQVWGPRAAGPQGPRREEAFAGASGAVAVAAADPTRPLQPRTSGEVAAQLARSNAEVRGMLQQLLPLVRPPASP